MRPVVLDGFEQPGVIWGIHLGRDFIARKAMQVLGLHRLRSSALESAAVRRRQETEVQLAEVKCRAALWEGEDQG